MSNGEHSFFVNHALEWSGTKMATLNSIHSVGFLWHSRSTIRVYIDLANERPNVRNGNFRYDENK